MELEARAGAQERERAKDAVLDRVLPERKSSVPRVATRSAFQGRHLDGERGERAKQGPVGEQSVEQVGLGAWRALVSQRQ